LRGKGPGGGSGGGGGAFRVAPFFLGSSASLKPFSATALILTRNPAFAQHQIRAGHWGMAPASVVNRPNFDRPSVSSDTFTRAHTGGIKVGGVTSSWLHWSSTSAL